MTERRSSFEYEDLLACGRARGLAEERGRARKDRPDDAPRLACARAHRHPVAHGRKRHARSRLVPEAPAELPQISASDSGPEGVAPGPELLP